MSYQARNLEFLKFSYRNLSTEWPVEENSLVLRTILARWRCEWYIVKYRKISRTSYIFGTELSGLTRLVCDERRGSANISHWNRVNSRIWVPVISAVSHSGKPNLISAFLCPPFFYIRSVRFAIRKVTIWNCWNCYRSFPKSFPNQVTAQLSLI